MCLKCKADSVALDQARGATLAEALDRDAQARFTMRDVADIITARHADDARELSKLGVYMTLRFLRYASDPAKLARMGGEAGCAAALDDIERKQRGSTADLAASLRVLADLLDAADAEHAAKVEALKARAATVARATREN